MRVVADEFASELLIETSPASPRADDHLRIRQFVHSVHRRARAALLRDAMQQVIEVETRHSARGVRKRELVSALRADDAAALDARRAGLVDLVHDAEWLEHGERVVREKLAAQFVAREGIAIVERDVDAASGEERGERGAGGGGANDCYAFHKRIPKRTGQTFTPSPRFATTFAAISRASDTV